MEEIYASGRAKAIGVSNFQPHHLRKLLGAAEVRPAVNQIEVSPFLAQDELRAFDAEHEIVTEAWSPIARGKVADDPVIGRIAERLGRSPARSPSAGTSSAATSSSRSRSPAAGSRRTSRSSTSSSTRRTWSRSPRLDRGERTGPNPDEFNYVPG